MTIKRRLQISNILMLVVPAITMMLLNIALVFIITKGMGIQDFETLGENAFYIAIGPPIIVAAVIFLTNKLLTRFVIVKITAPLDVLSDGVHQIRDGNLDYRIEYNGNDEFSRVCSDFNVMAQRLSDMVDARQKDETNRKELIAGISHDLRTPITGIKAYVEGLEKGVAATPQLQKKYLASIRNMTAELERTINQLFMLSKIDIGEYPFILEKVNVNAELVNLIDNVSEGYETKGLSISYTPVRNAAYVIVDIQQFRNSITNIMENSLRYKNRERGELVIATHTDDDGVIIELKDNGPGVSEDALPKLFNVFYRGDPSRNSIDGGSGLGLAITAKILERLGGGIKAENVPDGGLAIIITLPNSEGDTSREKDTNY